MTNPYRALWVAALVEKLRVALGVAFEVDEYQIARARRWVGSEDFVGHCDLAGVDPDAILDFYRARLGANDPGAPLRGPVHKRKEAAA